MKKNMKLASILLSALCLYSPLSLAEHVVASDTYSSMALPNDAKLYNAPTTSGWASGATIVQGIPRGDAAPSYWADEIIDKSMTTSEPWSGMTQWFTVFEDQKNTSRNVRVVIGDADMWLLQSTDGSMDPLTAEWVNVTVTKAQVNWAAYYSHNIIKYIEDVPYRRNADGLKEYELHTDHYPLHGGTSKVEIDGENVLAAFVRMKAWLVPDKPQGKQDVATAKVLISTGADYYPTVNTSVSHGDLSNANYLPGAGGSRFQYLTTTPTWYYMGTVAPDDLSIVDDNSPYIKSGGKTYLTKEEWYKNPPPIHFEPMSCNDSY
ncbi:hypothetical protein GNP44_13735 [Aliivibrio fischeri]|uniref:hypothetical protein n=1 Tax=Aliivibrio fischeri TaxID=668 RepID=UPI0012D94ADA|nr:hypothetical protein [Aliivibrio fischeri]MUK31134.1 hypothetical protein [Aliivibrio fischeri]